MLTVEDLKNLIVLVNRAAYGNLNEAKAGCILEQKLKDMIKVAQATATPTEEVVDAQ